MSNNYGNPPIVTYCFVRYSTVFNSSRVFWQLIQLTTKKTFSWRYLLIFLGGILIVKGASEIQERLATHFRSTVTWILIRSLLASVKWRIEWNLSLKNEKSNGAKENYLKCLDEGFRVDHWSMNTVKRVNSVLFSIQAETLLLVSIAWTVFSNPTFEKINGSEELEWQSRWVNRKAKFNKRDPACSCGILPHALGPGSQQQGFRSYRLAGAIRFSGYFCYCGYACVKPRGKTER